MRSAFAILSILILMSAGRAHAIAVADESAATNSPTGYGYSLDWDYIYQYQGASSVAVDHYWILTAAHVADDGRSTTNLTINGELYRQQEIVFHPTADLALVRYDKPFPGYYALHAGEISTTVGSGKNKVTTYNPLIMAGYGYPGVVTATTFTQSGSTGTKRWGTNKGSGSTSTVPADIGGGVIKSTICFPTTFDLSGTAFEAGANIYDSGGPVFIEVASEWELTGINLYREGATSPYTGNSAAMIHDYLDWITNSIPDYDTDMDGLPDWWEAQYGPLSAGDDADKDGFTNYEEWLADSVPNDSNSFLRVTNYSTPTNVTFSSSTNRKYQIEFRTNLVEGVWEEEGGWFAGSAPQTSAPVSTPTSNRFYRVRANLP
ncbi:trypsin-like serine protease [Pontiella sulfatireligans]|uniref:Peptidase S1 domain-containing protein n=1 Tax=Pontiella sulfatireligans TaxID=2750658 RepID=A0A6C2ULZ7_9BACT|nr:trypsin-like serine protease [Pontiella sulfatireligans]VGO20371.1 hypothetical protein SCARR_02434 [Pontiella sulfatireligans]